MKNELGKIFFTEYDEKITGSSKRDPLGLQPIWSYYGRRVIKHLTTVSNDIRGFREVLLCLSICGAVEDNQSKSRNQELILLFEQLFVYSTIINNKKDGILGADNGTVRYTNTGMKTEVSADNTILVKEISLGYYGRYKSPLTTMGIINRNSNICTDIDVEGLFGKERYNEILKAFKNFISKNSGERKLKNFCAFPQIFEAVNGKFRPYEGEFWLSRLQIEGSQKEELMNECYKRVDANQSSRKVFDDLLRDSRIKDIENLEPFLRCMEDVFYKALSSRNIKDIVISKEEHKQRYKQFCTICDTKDGNSQMLNKRVEYIKKECNPENDNYIQSILDYHKIVSEQKRSAVWIETDIITGNIQAFVQPDITDVNIGEWGRDYYLSSLLSIKEGIVERTG